MREQITENLTLTKGTPSKNGGYATVARGQAAIARISLIDWWNNAWDDASSKSEPAEAVTNPGSAEYPTFKYKYPLTETDQGGTVTRHKVTDTLTVSSTTSWAVVKRGTALIARVKAVHEPTIDQVWTSSSIPSGAEEKTAIKTQYEQAKADSDNFCIRIDCGGTKKTYYCTP